MKGDTSIDKRVNLPKRHYNPKTELKTDPKLIEMKGEIDTYMSNYSWRLQNSPSNQQNRQKKKISKDMRDLNNNINQTE